MPSALVVDDDRAILGMLSEVLPTEGYTVQIAEHGDAALDTCERTVTVWWRCLAW
jgi:CheY-like chemotaxis protein